MIHEMSICSEEYEKVQSGVKRILYELLDSKRKKIKVGDAIILTNAETDQQVLLRVLSLCYAKSFYDLPVMGSRDGLICYSAELDPKKLSDSYSPEDFCLADGVVAIGIILMKEKSENKIENDVREIVDCDFLVDLDK